MAIGLSSGLGLGIDIGSKIEHSADLLPQYLPHSRYPQRSMVAKAMACKTHEGKLNHIQIIGSITEQTCPENSAPGRKIWSGGPEATVLRQLQVRRKDMDSIHRAALHI